MQKKLCEKIKTLFDDIRPRTKKAAKATEPKQQGSIIR